MPDANDRVPFVRLTRTVQTGIGIGIGLMIAFALPMLAVAVLAGAM